MEKYYKTRREKERKERFFEKFKKASQKRLPFS